VLIYEVETEKGDEKAMRPIRIFDPSIDNSENFVAKQISEQYRDDQDFDVIMQAKLSPASGERRCPVLVCNRRSDIGHS
jgi:hypothetical protein